MRYGVEIQEALDAALNAEGEREPSHAASGIQPNQHSRSKVRRSDLVGLALDDHGWGSSSLAAILAAAPEGCWRSTYSIRLVLRVISGLPEDLTVQELREALEE